MLINFESSAELLASRKTKSVRPCHTLFNLMQIQPKVALLYSLTLTLVMITMKRYDIKRN